MPLEFTPTGRKSGPVANDLDRNVLDAKTRAGHELERCAQEDLASRVRESGVIRAEAAAEIAKASCRKKCVTD